LSIELGEHLAEVLSMLSSEVLFLQFTSSAPYPSFTVGPVHYRVIRQYFVFDWND
jgi:hypothetical protein